MLLHLGIMHVAAGTQAATVWNRLVPRSQLLCALLFVFGTALTPNGRWWTWAVYGSAIVLLMLVSKVHLPTLSKRVAVELLFVAVLLLSTLFREGGAIVWQWGILRITTEGLTVLGSVMVKTVLSLFVLNILILTVSVPALLRALVELKVPPLLVAILSSMFRYLDVLMDEFQSMQRAAQSRNLMNDRSRQRTVVGNMIGSLFVRTYERGERVHQAMLSRGYDGMLPLVEMPIASRLDVLALTLVFIILLSGQLIYLF